MINFKKAIGGSIVGVSLLIGAAGADAACSVSGKVRQVYSSLESSDSFSAKGYSYVIIESLGGFFSTSGITYYGYSYNDKVTSTAGAAQSNNANTTIQGDAASCPTTGSARFIGQVTTVYTGTNY